MDQITHFNLKHFLFIFSLIYKQNKICGLQSSIFVYWLIYIHDMESCQTLTQALELYPLNCDIFKDDLKKKRTMLSCR